MSLTFRLERMAPQDRTGVLARFGLPRKVIETLVDAMLDRMGEFRGIREVRGDEWPQLFLI